MKRILITGNSGYIGSHLSQRLAKKYEVLGLDIVYPKTLIRDHILADVRKVYEISYHFDTVIHLAALVKVNESVEQPFRYFDTNLNGSVHLLNKVKFNNFVFASTGTAEYCNNPYGVSKRAAEDCIRQYCIEHKIPWTIFRFYNVIGTNGFSPTNPDGLFYNLIKAKQTGRFTIFGSDYNTRDGTAERDYVHVEEICTAIETAIENPANSLENLGHGQGYTVKEMVDIFKKVNQVQFDIDFGPRRQGDLERSVLSKPSTYLPNLYDINNLLQLTTNML